MSSAVAPHTIDDDVQGMQQRTHLSEKVPIFRSFASFAPHFSPVYNSPRRSPSHFGTPLRCADSVEENVSMRTQILENKS
jgi:hypothetical protein